MAVRDLEFIERLMDTFSASPLSSMTLRQGDFEVCMERDPAARTAPLEVTPAVVTAGKPSGEILEAALSGVVYLAPSPDAPPFAPVGRRVSQGDTVMLCEAMKTMMPVVSPFDGEIKAVLVKDGTFVEIGEPLLRYRVKEA